MLQALINKFRDIRQTSANRKEFMEKLIEATSDGVLTPDEIQELDALKAQFQLTDDEFRKMRMAALQAAYEAVSDDGVLTPQESADFQQIMQYLDIQDVEVPKTARQLQKLRLIYEIERGTPPVTIVPGLALQKGEQAYWSEPASLLEEKVVRREYTGRSSGVSIRIAKGVSYRVGASRGVSVPVTDIVTVSTGELVITNKRVLFRGNAKSFSLKIPKILDVQFYQDGLSIANETSKTKVVKLGDVESLDVVGAVLSYVLNNNI